MSLHIYIALTGEHFTADPGSFTSLEALRAWIAKTANVAAPNQISLTSAGKQPRVQTLAGEKELFVYDRRFLAPGASSTQATIPLASVPPFQKPSNAPDNLANQNDFQAWQNLFRARRNWTQELAERCRSMGNTTQKYLDEIQIIERSVGVATGNLQKHVGGIEEKYGDARSWVEEVLGQQQGNLETLESDLVRLERIPAKEDFAKFLLSSQDGTPKAPTKKGKSNSTTLRSFLDAEEVKRAASVTRTTLDKFSSRFQELGVLVETIISDSAEVLRAVEEGQVNSSIAGSEDSNPLMEEIEIVAKKITSDHEYVMTLPSNSKSIGEASRMAALHTRTYLPSLKEWCVEMHDFLKVTADRKNASTRAAIQKMQDIAAIESMLSNVTSQLNNLDLPADSRESLELLGLVSRLPYVYGSLLIEAVRRKEWADKMKTDSAALAEELAGYQEEEEKRRRKWLKSIEGIISIDALKGKAIGVEVNLQGEESSWPAVSRQDLQDFLKVLSGVEGLEAEAKELGQTFKDMDRPTKQQIKHAKGFKMGSIHEAGFGKNSLLLRGTDEMRVLKDANAKLEEELKGQKSRVRKLEDLLHRQSQIARISTGISFQGSTTQDQFPSDPPPTSPRPHDHLSRTPSLSSRRLSGHATEEKTLVRRIVSMEADLISEREQRAALEKQSAAFSDREAELKRQVDEANSTKQDLMENMEAQQKEFADERRLLEGELQKQKLRVEEVEDEIDRILGSRDTESRGADARFQALELEMHKLREKASQAEADAANERERRLFAEEALQTANSAHERRDRVDAEQKTMLLTAYSLLAAEGEPAEHTNLFAALEDLAQRSKDHIQDLSEAIALAQAENLTLQTSVDKHKAEVSENNKRLADGEVQASRLRNELSTAEARSTALATELHDATSQLNELRKKFADGEVGSDALRIRVSEEEAKVHRLTVELAKTKSHVNELDVELYTLQKKYDKLETASDVTKARLEERSIKAKEVTKRLHVQNEKLNRLLEALGFAVTHKDDSMVILRASKMTGSVSNLLESQAMGRSVSSPVPSSRTLDNPADMSTLLWMEPTDGAEEEARYRDFISAVDRFNLDIFSETIIKRIRDYDHTLRKVQREGRVYRDKAIKYQTEAHEKLALRGFKEGDLALFLPTRNQATRPWAAFNVGAPHYFLREHDNHRLRHREWLVARIQKIEERVVDLSKNLDGGASNAAADGRSINSTSDGAVSFVDDDNPFELSDGLRWYLLDAVEEKSGAPTTPGLGKSTIAATNIDAKGSIRINKKGLSAGEANKALNKSLESRRSSSNSKKSVPAPTTTSAVSEIQATGTSSRLRAGSNSSSQPAEPMQGVEGTGTGLSGGAERGSAAADAAADEQAAAARSTTASPTKRPSDASLVTSTRNLSPSKLSPSKDPIARLSPSKSLVEGSPSGSPSKQIPRPAQFGSNSGKPGFWDSLWSFDISVESGKRK